MDERAPRAASQPRLTDFLRTHAELRHHLSPTPLTGRHDVRPASGGPAVAIRAKHEHAAPGGSFKCRGALYRLSLLTPDERAAGVVTSSTGNHGIAVALAAEVFGTRAHVVVPDDAPDVKVDQVRRHGAEISRVGSSLAEAVAAARDVAAASGRVYIDDGGDVELALGAGTIALEILFEQPETTAILIPVGGGNLIAGIAACAKAINPEIEIVGVQSAAAPSVHDSWRAGLITRRPCATFAEGLATEEPGHLAFALLRTSVDDITLVTDDQLREAMAVGRDQLGVTLEGAGAAALAGALARPQRWRSGSPVVVLSGGNV